MQRTECNAPSAAPRAQRAECNAPSATHRVHRTECNAPSAAHRVQRSAPSAAHRVQPNPKTPHYTQSRLPATLRSWVCGLVEHVGFERGSTKLCQAATKHSSKKYKPCPYKHLDMLRRMEHTLLGGTSAGQPAHPCASWHTPQAKMKSNNVVFDAFV